MTGLQRELRDRILGSQPHIYVWKQGGITHYHAEVRKLRGVAGVTGAAPPILDKGMVQSRQGDPAFITLKGIDPSLEGSVTDLARSMVRGQVTALASTADAPRRRATVHAAVTQAREACFDYRAST